MTAWHTGFRLGMTGRLHPGVCSICGPTAFAVMGTWLRDRYLCVRCFSIPRQRALFRVLTRVAPGWRDLTIFESSPNGPASAKLQRECPGYQPSQFFDDVPSGTLVDGVRREDLRELTLADESVDLVITQDVFEHIVGPDKAFRQIVRVLRPGGLHVFTVPIFTRSRTVVRVSDDGQLLMEPDYHMNPVGDGRSLVAREWGADILEYILETSGAVTERYDETSWWYVLRGQMKDVLVTRKAG